MMPTHLVKRINLDLLYPPFLAKVLELLAECERRGAHYYCTYGMRTFQEQAKLYFQGRTTPGKIVTNAKAGYSCHNYGIAVDVVRDADMAKAGLQPDWGTPGYDLLKEVGEEMDLQVGVAGLSDPGHVQVPLIAKLGRKERDVLAELKTIHDKDGLEAVWKHIDVLLVK